ncbi:hypothetical protein AWH62_04605 [Maricaulis sp. W15]|uniref:DUF6702 family protein n=1 Tax=Maricaulis sp. W15 TaxID=1772333 RepID=UPI000948BBC9|nr:DUF6702 family protein [Maricaulis sp. W15]OLF77952.1 hypothetical protein AWH62_04605 [Maricaulis sp. W15]
MRAPLTLLTLLAGLSLVTAPSHAHRMHAGVTEIAVNARTAELEIIHRIYAHDLMEALDRTGLDAVDFLATPDGMAAVGAYAAGAFRMADTDGELLEPAFVGAEIDGEFAWIYFAAPVPAEQASFIVDNDLLAETFDDQVMMTNLRFNSLVRTAMQGPGRRTPVRVRFSND